MPRYKITVEYDGGPFVGWQRQDTGPSVQAALEDAVFAFSGERVQVQSAGRTDSGVHALGQVAHFDLATEKPLHRVSGALNFHLKPHPIAVPKVELGGPGFHARFSAIGRRYLYRILNRRAPAALDRGQVWHVPVPLDVEAMAGSAAVLVGRHDFNSFRSTACQSPTSIKTLDRLSVSRRGEEIHIEVVPAQPGPHPGRHAGAGRTRPVEPARRRGGAGRLRPHTGGADRATARSLPDRGALQDRGRGRLCLSRRRSPRRRGVGRR